MAACGGHLTVVVTEEGKVWACGDSRDGQLGQGDRSHQLLPARLGMQAPGGRRAVMVAAGWYHTAAAMQDKSCKQAGADAGGAGALWQGADGDGGGRMGT